MFGGGEGKGYVVVIEARPFVSPMETEKPCYEGKK